MPCDLHINGAESTPVGKCLHTVVLDMFTVPATLQAVQFRLLQLVPGALLFIQKVLLLPFRF